MIRERLTAALKDAGNEGDERAAATLRLVLAALKERDACARDNGEQDEICEAEIVEILRSMIAQRHAEVGRCENNAQLDLAEQAQREIEILSRFVPPAMSEAEVTEAVDDVIEDLGVTRLKDTGRVINELRERYDGQMDLARAKRRVCERLA